MIRKEININDFDYNLPIEQIAQFPIKNRDESKLLVFKENKVVKEKFYNLQNYIPDNSLLIFNNTKVIPARLLFKKETGALIEIFCLEPFDNTDYQSAMLHKGFSEWKCFIGKSKKWKSGPVKCKTKRNDTDIIIAAEKISQHEDSWIIRFSWEPDHITFAEVLELTGHTPLPPYINRNDTVEDRLRYQTIYAQYNGSVAAPTAGLHFTENILNELAKKNIKTENITLHVGAGTFKPVNKSISEHIMHSEPFIVRKEFLESMLNNLSHPIIPVGTTSVRTIESIYWLGVKLIIDGKKDFSWHIEQFDPYNSKYNIGISNKDALVVLIDYLNENNLQTFAASTQLMILPSYKFAFPDAIITNFHQPKSTLLLLVSAFCGDSWKSVYRFAIDNDFRFLSYGDSSLLWKFENSIK